MLNKKMIACVFASLIGVVNFTSANAAVNYKLTHPGYFGVIGGYGSTTWEYLVPKEPNAALNVSTPTEVTEGGELFGVYAGYEFLPAFALEGSYLRYPTAELTFDESSEFTFMHGDRTQMNSHTEVVELSGKIMLLLNSPVRVFSTIGIADLHRYDAVVDRWRVTPVFGFGFNYNITERIMLEFGGEYVAGNGQSELDPADHFIPFLYSAFAKLAYRVG